MKRGAKKKNNAQGVTNVTNVLVAVAKRVSGALMSGGAAVQKPQLENDAPFEAEILEQTFVADGEEFCVVPNDEAGAAEFKSQDRPAQEPQPPGPDDAQPEHPGDNQRERQMPESLRSGTPVQLLKGLLANLSQMMRHQKGTVALTCAVLLLALMIPAVMNGGHNMLGSARPRALSPEQQQQLELLRHLQALNATVAQLQHSLKHLQLESQAQSHSMGQQLSSLSLQQQDLLLKVDSASSEVLQSAGSSSSDPQEVADRLKTLEQAVASLNTNIANYSVQKDGPAGSSAARQPGKHSPTTGEDVALESSEQVLALETAQGAVLPSRLVAHSPVLGDSYPDMMLYRAVARILKRGDPAAAVTPRMRQVAVRRISYDQGQAGPAHTDGCVQVIGPPCFVQLAVVPPASAYVSGEGQALEPVVSVSAVTLLHPRDSEGGLNTVKTFRVLYKAAAEAEATAAPHAELATATAGQGSAGAWWFGAQLGDARQWSSAGDFDFDGGSGPSYRVFGFKNPVNISATTGAIVLEVLSASRGGNDRSGSKLLCMPRIMLHRVKE